LPESRSDARKLASYEVAGNIREAIQLWLEVAEEDARAEAGREAGTLAEVFV
jgi:hypothetical protein